MVVEGSSGEDTTKVTVVVSSTGETVRPITVFLVTSDDTATGEISIWMCVYTSCEMSPSLQLIRTTFQSIYLSHSLTT